MGRIMKRNILALSLLSLSVLALVAGIANAWCCKHRCMTHITCRPYNAFTPICWGNLVCDGCCPSMGNGGCQMPMGVVPWAASGSCGMTGDSWRATDQPRPNPAPGNYTPPNPMPLPAGPGTTMMYPPMGVYQASYYPMYMPQYPNYYVPNYYNPYAYQPMPYYWYNGR
jgi:hypothetical protein